MKAILRLIDDHGMGTIDNIVRYLLAPVSGQTVHDNSIFPGAGKHFFVNLIPSKYFLPLFLFRLLTHARPDVRINYICILNSISRITIKSYTALGLFRAPFQYIMRGLVFFRTRKAEPDRKPRCGVNP